MLWNIVFVFLLLFLLYVLSNISYYLYVNIRGAKRIPTIPSIRPATEDEVLASLDLDPLAKLIKEKQKRKAKTKKEYRSIFDDVETPW